MESQKKIRVGVLLNRLSTGAWSYDVLKEISESSYAEIGLVILNGSKSKERSAAGKVFTKFKYLLSHLYERADKAAFKAKPDAFKSHDLSGLLGNIPVITAHPQSKGLSQWFSEDDIAKIKSHNIDVMLRMGFSILKGDVLQAVPYGIWSLHHGDNKINRGGPPGFWEMYLKQPVTGTVLQVLTEDLDNGPLLAKTYAATHKYSLNLSKNEFYWKSGRLITRSLEALHSKGFEALKKSHIRDFYFYDRPQYTRATNSVMLGFVMRLVSDILSKGIRNIFKRNQWFLLYGLSKDGNMVQRVRRMKKIEPPADRFWADPFIVYREGKYFIFLEEKISGSSTAHISVMEMDENGNYKPPVPVLKAGYHLSYPFVFEHEGDFYMMPETKSKSAIEVFRCKRFPDQWEFHKTIFNNIKAVDPTLFKHGKWYLFTGVADGPSISRNDELFIYFSDSPFGPWHAHPQNPVVSDVRRARPAGKIFQYKNKLYRPAQDCSVTYGYGIRMHEIIKLDENTYEEREVDFIEPLWNDDVNGTHTFAFEHNLTMIDAVMKRWKS